MIFFFYYILSPILFVFSLYNEGYFQRRIALFFFGVLLSIFILSIGPNNRLKENFLANLDYFNMNKRVIFHLNSGKINFSEQAECQLSLYKLHKEQVLDVLKGGRVNFQKSDKKANPCQVFVVEKQVSTNFLSVSFEFCQSLSNTIEVLHFLVDQDSKKCLK